MSGMPAGFRNCLSCPAVHNGRGLYCPRCVERGKESVTSLPPQEQFDAVVQKNDEKALQRDAMKWLLLNGAVGIVWHRTDDRTTCAKGVSDFVFLWRGRYVAAEAKVGKRKTTPEQDRFLADVNKNGGAGFVFRSVEELRARLEKIEHADRYDVVIPE